ncbi:MULTISPECIES: hypothetical protein [unclassified Streptomyces]|uniref:hypothetical protein n=1 Tax=unclassified Streptomyces TaxID=2593676 RepID=UPI00224DB28E|nr:MULTISPECIES: hypothetical protein [unclassified Streptomyces]MCX4524622.1 hypothetical protein [Streptomyces sp. NBC_01551]MCX4544854.1 hypothetical protein [Streptomyces sp. NBC_01565]
MNHEKREQAQRFLRPDERLIAACAYELGPGVPLPPEDLLAPAEPLDLGRRIEARLPRPLRQLVTRGQDSRPSRPAAAADAAGRAPQDPVDDPGARLAHGTSMEGGWQSSAGHFLVSRANVRGSVTGVLAVTDRRWFGLSDVSPLWQTTPALKQYWEAPRSAITALRANPTGVLQRGRMEIQFTDGSWVAVLATLPAHAAPFAAAAARLR